MNPRAMLTSFTTQLNNSPESVAFSDTMTIIDGLYNFTPTQFKNGDLINEKGQNSGSCKLFAFAKLNNFNAKDTLTCFGTYYRNDVLENPEGDDHQNIRNFMKSGWEGVSFDGIALEFK